MTEKRSQMDVSCEVVEGAGGFHVVLAIDGQELERFGPVRERTLAVELQAAMLSGAVKATEAALNMAGGTVTREKP